MRKLILQLENINDVPKEALNIAKLIEYKQAVDTIITKAKIETLLDNLSNLENVLRLNNVDNEIVKREIQNFKEMLYNKQSYFLNQEKLLA